jgi:hypothetical protein
MSKLSERKPVEKVALVNPGRYDMGNVTHSKEEDRYEEGFEDDEQVP